VSLTAHSPTETLTDQIVGDYVSGTVEKVGG
jgi:hypothetical protein